MIDAGLSPYGSNAMRRMHLRRTLASAISLAALDRATAQDATFGGKIVDARILLTTGKEVGTRLVADKEVRDNVKLCSLDPTGVRCRVGKEIKSTLPADQVQSVSTAAGMYTYNPRTRVRLRDPREAEGPARQAPGGEG